MFFLADLSLASKVCIVLDDFLKVHKKRPIESTWVVRRHNVGEFSPRGT